MEQMTPQLRGRDYLCFTGVVIFAHVGTYLVVGMLAYHFIYKAPFEAAAPGLFMRNPNNPEEWRHVETWFLPGQALRGLLFGVALCPFLKTLAAWNLRSRFLSLFGLLLVFSLWSVTMPAPGSIEGWVYLKPSNGLTLPNPLLGYIEIPTQLAAFAFLVSWRIGKLRPRGQWTRNSGPAATSEGGGGRVRA